MLDMSAFCRITAVWKGMSTTEQLRSAFWLVNVGSVLRVAVEFVRQDGGAPIPLWLKGLSAAGLLALSTWGWRRRRFPHWFIPIDALLLLLVGAGLNNVINLTGVLYTTLHLRNLYGRNWAAAVRTVVFAGTVIVLTRLSQTAQTEQSHDNTLVFLIPALVMMTITFRVLAACLHRLEASRNADAALAEAAGAMLAADRSERVVDLVEDAVAAIVPGARCVVRADGGATGADRTSPGGHELVLPLARAGRTYGQLAIDGPTRAVKLRRDTLETLAANASSALKTIELRSVLDHRANHDPLTELANRRLFTEALTRTVGTPGRRAAVIFIDLDDFKWVNDTLGHSAGDKLLIEIGNRLRGCVRTTELLARLGGDEFAVLVTDVADATGATAIAERVLAALREPVDLGERAHQVTCSIGVAVGGGVAVGVPATNQAERLLRSADAAMYASKVAGKNRCSVADDVQHPAPVPAVPSASDPPTGGPSAKVPHPADGPVAGFVESLSGSPNRWRLEPPAQASRDRRRNTHRHRGE